MRVVVSQYEGIDATPVLPLAAGVLVATIRADPELAAATTLAVEVVRQPIAAAVAALADPDVLGLSLYPWNATYALAVAAAARAAHPAALIVVGGPSVPRRPAQARAFLDAHPAVDVLVLAEGEVTFRELVRARLHGRDLAHLPGVVVRAAGGAHLVTAPPARVLDLAATGSPFLDGTFDELWARHRERFAMVLLETNRGCPFSCTFCDWSLTKKVVEFPLARVEAELAWVAAHGLTHLMLADANFGIRPRDTQIARMIADLRRRTGRPASFYFYLTKNDHARNLETIDILHGADIGTWVGLAVQDFDDGVLAAVERDNIQTGEARALREICGARGIPTFNELILGLPGQTYASFTHTLAEATPPWSRHDFVLFLCRLIDNAELGSPASRAQHGLETRICRWTTSTGVDAIVDEVQEVVVATKDLPLAEWRRAYACAFLTAALYNLRLARVVLYAAADGLGGGRRELLAALAEELTIAAPGSVYAELGAVVERYAAALLAGEPFVLPSPDAEPGAAPVPVDDAIAIAALARYDGFLAETEAVVRRVRGLAPSTTDVVAEAVELQRLITPRFGDAAPRTRAFAHAWPAYLAAATAGAAPAPAPTVVTFTPPSYVGVASFAAFVTTHLGVLRTRLAVGELITDAPTATPAVAPVARPPRLVVLPASG
ncbi:MAG: cobalamin-dependent protein [Myxococcales bacterium]|nr:cobalamin-dependent protein [Myxococcales bacterium]